MNESPDFGHARCLPSAGSLVDRSGITVDLSSGDQPVPMLLESSRVLRDRYVIERQLGQGGKGTVFKALDRYRAGLPLSQQYVAIKVLHMPSGPLDEPNSALSGEMRCAQVLSHRNIIKVFDIDRHRGLDFMTMEYLEGEPLSSLLARFRSSPLPRTYAWSIIRQIAEGLHHAHQRGIVHADLKPANIWITHAGEVRILDFGGSHWAAARDGRRIERPATSVSPAYASCELLNGRTPDPRDDLYALACITYEVLAGTHPFQRRRATEARDFGLVPERPQALSRSQWKTLLHGMSWLRAGRSVRVSEWLKKLKPDFREPPPLVDLGSLQPAPAAPPRASHFRASVAIALSLGAICLLVMLLAPGVRGSSQAMRTPPAEIAAAVSQPPLKSVPQTPAASVPATPSGDIRVLPGQRFAEIRLHRPASTHGNLPFVWWTEAASAKPGIDYVDQSKVAQTFPAGKDAVSVFVKLLPRPPGDRRGVFFIAVADSAVKGPAHVVHTAVRLPPSSMNVIS